MTPALPSPSREALVRAALTCCMDSAHALMYATLNGADSAEVVWRDLITADSAATKRLEQAVCEGLTRWGSRITSETMTVFRNALESWRSRAARLPSTDLHALASWMTAEGTYWIIAPDHASWPTQLADLAIRSDWSPPLCLWGRGDPYALTSCPKPVGIVGSRDANEYGRYTAHHIAEYAATHGHSVISGGAMGIDAAAHQGALDAAAGHLTSEVGPTIAVFAGGLNHRGPSRNLPLFNRIETQGGALISELPPHVIPEARRFLLRNRIIAALSSTLVVSQARLRSGAINTATWGCELMREVYAVPGNINESHNAGCNKLIAEGKAIMLHSLNSLDEVCHTAHTPIKPITPSSPDDHNDEIAASNAANDTMNDELNSADDIATNEANDTNDNHQHLVVAVLKQCARRRIQPTPDALAKLMRERVPDMPMGRLLQTLGELEMTGVITREHGVVRLA